MIFCSDSVKKILACDQIAEDLVFDKRPSNQELIFGHILLSYEEGQPATPGDLVNLIGCSPESLRLMLRKAEKGKYLFSGGRPKYEILPGSKLLWLTHKISQEWLVRNQRRLLPFRPTVREVYTVTQAFDIHSRTSNRLSFVFKSPVKRGIVFFLLDRMNYGYFELKRLKHNFPIDPESLRQFINIMQDAGYFEKMRKGNQTLIRASQSLQTLADEEVTKVCLDLNKGSNSFRPYSDFVARLKGNSKNLKELATAAQ